LNHTSGKKKRKAGRIGEESSLTTNITNQSIEHVGKITRCPPEKRTKNGKKKGKVRQRGQKPNSLPERVKSKTRKKKTEEMSRTHSCKKGLLLNTGKQKKHSLLHKHTAQQE
jgi:hypothetical protein